jgi:nucleotide-binding universal stress UspA family protein
MYKTILVHIDGTAESIGRTQVAARLAIRYEGHLVGAAVTGLSPFMFPIGSIEAGAPPIVFPIDELRAEAERALDLFDKTASSEGLNSYERRVVDDEAGIGISLQARYSDLVVVSQAALDEFRPRLRSDFPEYVLMNGSRPTLVLPQRSVQGEIGRSVTVAWNGSPEAVRAITTAIPLLKRAQNVNLVVLEAGKEADLHGDEPGADMALYLARHGIKVQVTATGAGRDDGDALLSFATDTGADLIVMGAYGHSRFREFLLGGMTRTALGSSPVALWMSH